MKLSQIATRLRPAFFARYMAVSAAATKLSRLSSSDIWAIPTDTVTDGSWVPCANAIFCISTADRTLSAAFLAAYKEQFGNNTINSSPP